MSDTEPSVADPDEPQAGSESARHERAADTDDLDREELIAALETLRQENRRLRESYIQAKTTQYRRVAVGFVVLGVLGTLGAAVFPSARTVLLALGATGLFSGLLTYYLTPEQFITADVGESAYATLAANLDAIVSELGLTDERIYVPVGETHSRVKLYIPQRQQFDLPDDDALRSVFVVTSNPEQRGIALDSAGNALFTEFERTLDAPLGDTIDEIAPQLRDGLVDQFELVGSVEFDSDPAQGRVTAAIRGSVYGEIRRPDHPVTAFLAVGLARGLGQAVSVEIADSETPTVTVRWETTAPDQD